jgi:hypothetical protein
MPVGQSGYIISDFRGINDAAETHLAKLSQHCDVVLILIYDPLERNLPEKGRYRFTDAVRDVVIDTAISRFIGVPAAFCHACASGKGGE